MIKNEPNKITNWLIMYNWQQKDWPDFKYDETLAASLLIPFLEKVGKSSGFIETLSKEEQEESVINVLVKEAIKTSEIEGEYISRKDVVSSIRKNLGFPADLSIIKDKRSEVPKVFLLLAVVVGVFRMN